MYIHKGDVMTAKISKWGNSAAIRLPKEIMDFLSLHIGDNVQLTEKNNAITITLVDEKRDKLIAEAKRIKSHANNEYKLLEGSIEDGLKHVSTRGHSPSKSKPPKKQRGRKSSPLYHHL